MLAPGALPDGAGVEVEVGLEPFVGLTTTGILGQTTSY